jgi:thiol-disulfide isomerase/thioredoxin/uncharacterized membrane protein YphA (DoxX/SURF4 family)
MDGLLLTARLSLALVLLVAALTKLADGEGSREAVRGFGVPERLVGPTAALLPLLELAAAVLLVPTATVPVGAPLAVALMGAFSAAIARSMARGEAPDCHCFGQLHSAPAGPKTLARNLLLAGIGMLVVIAGAGTSATSWIGTLSGTAGTALIAGVVVAVLVAACAALALSMLRRHGQLLLRVEALEEALVAHGIELPSSEPVSGHPAPELGIPGLDGQTVTLSSVLARAGGREILLLFTDPGCGPCSALLPQVAEWQSEHASTLMTVLVSRGGRGPNLAHAREHALSDVLVQDDREVSERYGVSGTPSALLLAADGTLASAVHAGPDAIRALVASRVPAPTLNVHQHNPQPAPDPVLRTLSGARSTLSSALAGPTAVLFWNPACGFCERMLPDLKRFESAPPPGAPGLVVISTGEAEQNRAMGLSAPVLLDDSFAAGTAFGAAGTPSALLIDADGRIASPIAVGAPAVLELLGATSAAVAPR